MTHDDVAVEISFRVHWDADGRRRVTLENPAWPHMTRISDEIITSAALPDPECVLLLRYPFLLIRVTNGHALYRVTTVEHGIWRAQLLEGTVEEKSP